MVAGCTRRARKENAAAQPRFLFVGNAAQPRKPEHVEGRSASARNLMQINNTKMRAGHIAH
jgi:hypothetical protein